MKFKIGDIVKNTQYGYVGEIIDIEDTGEGDWPVITVAVTNSDFSYKFKLVEGDNETISNKRN